MLHFFHVWIQSKHCKLYKLAAVFDFVMFKATFFPLGLALVKRTSYALPQWPQGFTGDVTLCVACDAVEWARKPQLILSHFGALSTLGPVMPWVLAWATWHHSAQPLSSSSFSSDIQGNKERITGRRKKVDSGFSFLLFSFFGRKAKGRRGGGEEEEAGKSSPGAEHTRELSLVHTNLATHQLWPMYSLREQPTPDKPTLPSLSHATLMSTRGRRVNDWADLPADKWSPGGAAADKLLSLPWILLG